MKTYYVYTLIDPRNNQVYYVGCTTNCRKRKYQHWSGLDNSSSKQRTIEIKQDGLKPVFEVVDEITTPFRQYALFLEGCWAAIHRKGGQLTNQRHSGYPFADIDEPEIERHRIRAFCLQPVERYWHDYLYKGETGLSISLYADDD